MGRDMTDQCWRGAAFALFNCPPSRPPQECARSGRLDLLGDSCERMDGAGLEELLALCDKPRELFTRPKVPASLPHKHPHHTRRLLFKTPPAPIQASGLVHAHILCK